MLKQTKIQQNKKVTQWPRGRTGFSLFENRNKAFIAAGKLFEGSVADRFREIGWGQTLQGLVNSWENFK